MIVLRALIFVSLILATLQEGSPEVTAFEFLTAGVLVVVLFWGTIHFLITYSISRPLLYFLGFLAWAGVNLVVALVNDVSLLWWFRRFFPVLTLPLTALASMVAFRTQKQIHAAFVMLLLIGVIIVLQALLQLRSVNLAVVTNLQDLRGYGGGYYSAFGLCLTVPFLFCRPRLRRPIRLLVICALAVFLFGLALSFTRTYWISTAVSLLFMIYILAQVRHVAFTLFLVRVVVPILLAIALLLWVEPTIGGFVVSRGVSIFQAVQDLSFLDRIAELEGLWDSAFENPVTILGGNGLGAKFTFYSPNPFSWGGTGWIENDYSHNYYAYLFWSTGIVGLSLFLLFWGSMLSRAIKALLYSTNARMNFPYYNYINNYYLIGICTVTINLLVASLTAPPLMGFKWAVYFGILIGIALNLMRLQQVTSNKASQ